MNYAITTRGLSKKYKDLTAVDNLDLEIIEGELFALLGVNGAGKTTTIKMLSTLTRPSEGDAMVSGESIITSPLSVKERTGDCRSPLIKCQGEPFFHVQSPWHKERQG